MNNKIRKNRILAEVHETATGLHRAGLIDKRRMGEFDALCNLGVPALGAAKIKRIRKQANVSQAVFAAVLNTSVSTVQK